MSHFYHPPQAIEMSIGLDDAPHGFTWAGDYHPVRYIVRDWHEDHGWWLRHKWRVYYRIITRTGLAVDLYQDLSTHKWFVQRLYD